MIREASKKNELFEDSEKKIVKNFSFLLILLNQAFFLPILLIYGIEAFRTSAYLISGTLEGWGIVYFLFFLLPFVTFLELQYFFLLFISAYLCFNLVNYFIIRKKSRHSKCFFCENDAKMGFIKIFWGLPSFFSFFGIPICEQHRKLLGEDRNKILIEEQRIYKRYTFLIRWLNVLIIVFGMITISISLFSFGIFFVENNLIILSCALFVMQVVLYVYLCIRMFLKIKKGINQTIEKKEFNFQH